MTARIPAGPPLSRADDTQQAVNQEVAVLIDETLTALGTVAGSLLSAVLAYPYFGLAHGHATLRETISWEWRGGPAVPGIHLWLRRVIAHTLAAADAVSAGDRDTAVLAAICREFSVCAETPPDGVTVFSLVDHGPLPGAAAFMTRLQDAMRRHNDVATAEDDELTKVVETVRALELQPWIPVTSRAAAVAMAGRASAAALIGVPEVTGPLRLSRRHALAKISFGPFGAVDTPALHPVGVTEGLPF